METRLLSNNYKFKTNKRNYKNNIQSEKKQLIKTLIDKKSILKKGVLTNCFMIKKNQLAANTNQKTYKQNYKNNNKSIGRVVINYDNKKLPKATKNVVNQNSVLSMTTFKRSFN